MKKDFLIFFFAFLFANVITLDVWVVLHSREAPPAVLSGEAAQVTKIPDLTSKPCDFSCPQSCLDKINEATASLRPAAQTEATPTVKTVVVTQPTVQLREFYVTFGGGSGQGNDWQNIDTSKTVVDLSKLGKIKYIVFEIVGRMVDDNMSATVRLFNVNDKRVVEGSEISFGKLSCHLTSSSQFVLDLAIKTYQIQIKTTANAIAYVDQARLRIVAE